MAEGKDTLPDIVPWLPVRGQKPCLVSGKVPVEVLLAVSVVAALLHVLFGTVTSTAVIVQVEIVMTALPVTSTAVVLVAVAFHGPVVCTTGVMPEKMFVVQLVNDGPVGLPAAFVVVATAPEAFTKVSIVHVTVPVPDVSVRAVECPEVTVFCGVQVTADAEDVNANIDNTANPTILVMRMNAPSQPGETGVRELMNDY